MRCRAGARHPAAGLPFTAITYFAVQEARRLRPQSATSFIGYLTVLYGIGQIGGPPLASWLVGQAGSASRGFAVALWSAAAALAAGALLSCCCARCGRLEHTGRWSQPATTRKALHARTPRARGAIATRSSATRTRGATLPPRIVGSHATADMARRGEGGKKQWPRGS